MRGITPSRALRGITPSRALRGITPGRAARGFTLVEVLVALVIVGAAAAVILAHLRTLFDTNDRLREHQRSVSRVLNRVALLHTEDFERARVTIEANAIALRTQGVPGTIEVANHTPDGRDVPPIDQAYTPMQRYTLTESPHRLQFLLPGLRAPR